MALTRWPPEPHPWLLPWEIWKLRNEVGPRPTNAPLKIPAYAHEFNTWTKWRRKNRPPPRPDIIKLIPKWAYRVLEQVMIAVPLIPPPPDPEPARPAPPDSWSLPYPIIYTTWGWPLEPGKWGDSYEGIDLCVEAGFKTIALQGGQFQPVHAERCRNRGLRVAVWGSPTSSDAGYLRAAEAEGYILQVETPDEYVHAVENRLAGVGDGLDLAMITTFGALVTYTSRNVGTPEEHPTTVETERLAVLGVTHAHVESYLGAMEPMDVGEMMFTGTRWRGLYYSKPVIGLSGIHPVSAYQPDIDAYGRQFGVYLAEQMRPVDWQAVKAL